MAEFGWAVLCTRAIIDRLNNQLSMIDAADVLWVAGPSIENELATALKEGHEGIRVPVKLTLVAWWYRSDYAVGESVNCRFSLIDPRGKTALTTPYSVDLTSGTGGRQFMAFENFPVTSFGLYRFVTEKEVVRDGGQTVWEVVSNLPLDVRLRPSTEQAPPSELPQPSASS